MDKEELKEIKEELEELFEPTVPMSITYEKWSKYWEKRLNLKR